MKASSSDERKALTAKLKTLHVLNCADTAFEDDQNTLTAVIATLESSSSTTDALEQLLTEIKKLEQLAYRHDTGLAVYNKVLALIRTAQSTAKEKEMKAE